MTLALPNLTSCSPRFATRRRPERPTFGTELLDIARGLGQPLMPHQRLVAEVGGEYDPSTGLPYYREIVVTLPRQHGKTTLFLSWQLHRCLSPRWAQPQRSAFTAQSGKDARDKWLDELFPLIRRSRRLRPFVARINEGMGNESIRFRNGSLIRLLSTSSSSGHSKTLHQATLDEIWHDADDRRQQGLRPAMVTVPDAQLLVCSTAGTDASVILNDKVERGREAVERDLDSGVAYFEWSAPDDWDPQDDDSYFGFMPALCPDPPCRCGVDDGGWRHTITLPVLRSERNSMKPSEFARAYGNRKQSAAADKVRAVARELWEDLAVPRQPVPDQLAIALVVNKARTHSYLGYAGLLVDGRVLVALAERPRRGTDGVVERLVQLKAERDPVAIAVDTRSEALLVEMQKAGLSVPEDPDKPERGDLAVMTANQVAAAFGMFIDAAQQRRLAHPDDAAVTAALLEAGTRSLAGGTAWDDAGASVEIAPLRAVTAALWALESRAHLIDSSEELEPWVGFG